MINHETFQSPKPSCHDALVGNWKPTAKDLKCGRKPGFGVTINIVNGGKSSRAGKFNECLCLRAKNNLKFITFLMKNGKLQFTPTAGLSEETERSSCSA